jgi:hypothetical protein
MREVAAELAEPAEKVKAALALVDELAAARGEGFVGILAKAAEEYRAHVMQATPPDAPFSRYVFHDLLAECNDPFSVAELETRLQAAGLRIVCETPLSRARTNGADGFAGLAATMAQTGSPFLQVLVCRDDVGAVARSPTIEAIRTMHLWADLAPAAGATFRTTTGVVLRAAPASGLARAARAAPGFVPVSALADDDASLAQLEHDLFVASCEGVLSLATEPAPVRGVSRTPHVAPHVRLRAREAIERGARTAVLTSAMHRSFRVPREELAIVRELDGETTVGAIAERAGVEAAAVEKVLDRFARHGFLVDAPVDAPEARS